MPTYAYECLACGYGMDELRDIDDRDAITLCPACGSEMQRTVSVPAFKLDDDWSTENDGRGRRMIGLGTPKNPVYARSLNDAIEYAKRHQIPYETD